MPTMPSRSLYWRRAIRSFLSQTYPHLELLIGLDAVADLRSPDSRIRIEVCPRQSSLGAKRNWLNGRASGAWICHWDDDDWSAPERVEKQLQASKTAACGLRLAHFWDEPTEKAYLYRGSPQYVIGSSLLYRKSYWSEHRFEGLNEGEDNGFVSKARALRQLTALDDLLMVATSHAGNTSRREYNKAQWAEAEKTDIPPEYFK